METFTKKQMDILTGSMLGDGSLTKIYGGRNSAFREGHCNRQFGYLEWKKNELGPHVTSFSDETRKTKPPGSKYVREDRMWVLRTKNSPTLTEMEKKWYLRDGDGNYVLSKGIRKKIIPNDIKLTPLAVAVWFCDDGTNMPRNRNAVFHTLSFSRDECCFLADRISADIGLKFCWERSSAKGSEVCVGAKSYLQLLELLESQIDCECMRYKTSTKCYIEPQRHRLYNDETIKRIVEMSNTANQKSVASEFCASESTVSMILSGKRWSGITSLPVRRLDPRNKSGVKGVHWDKNAQKWTASICVNGKKKYLGLFRSVEDAKKARRIAERIKSRVNC